MQAFLFPRAKFSTHTQIPKKMKRMAATVAQWYSVALRELYG